MVFFIQRWYHRAKRDLGAGRCDPTGDLKALPLDIILSIIDHLPAISILSFALTCRPFYHSLHHRLPSLQSLREKEEFLQLLEKDLHGYYFCYWCRKLHRWSSRWSSRWNRDYIWAEWQSSCLAAYTIIVPFPPSPSLRFGHARLVMNRHLYGASHGHPLWVLESQREMKIDNVQIRCGRQARVLDDELFLLSKCRLRAPHGEIEPLRRLLEAPELLRLCDHVWVKSDFLYQFELGETLRGMLENAPTMRKETVATSCPQCLTDCSMCVSWEGEQKGWQVQISVYQQLGSCRSPFDWKWRSMGEFSRYNEPRSLLYPAGVVRRRWIKEDEMDSCLDDTFIGNPLHLDAYVPG